MGSTLTATAQYRTIFQILRQGMEQNSPAVRGLTVTNLILTVLCIVFETISRLRLIQEHM
jgi:hypothetical protein